MPSVNEELIESAFLAEIRRFGATNEVVAEIKRVIREEVLPDIAETLNRLPFDQLTAQDIRLLDLRNAITDAMGWDRVTSKLEQATIDAARSELDDSYREFRNALPFEWEPTLIAPAQLVNIVMDRPFNNKIMREWFSELQATSQENIYEAFRIGMIEGKSIPQMTKDLLLREYGAFTTGGISRVFDNAEAVARTATTYSSVQTRLAFADQNSDVIKGVQYVATLDDRTTFICMSPHGDVYSLDEVGPIPPQHYNCRSTLAYVTKSWEEMGITGAREVEFFQRYRVTDATRMDGKIATPPDFDVWLKDQPVGTQNTLLGPVRAQMYRDGKIESVKDLVDADGATKLLDQFGVNRAGNPLKDAG